MNFILRSLLFLWFIPRNFGILLITGYQKLISPFLGQNCRYHPSCSSYTKLAIAYYGLVVGIIMGFWRVLRCNPWSAGGIDDVPERKNYFFRITKLGFVLANNPGKAD